MMGQTELRTAGVDRIVVTSGTDVLRGMNPSEFSD
jgi:hypothetical protein